MGCSEPTRICRSTSVPVTLTRCPTWLARLTRFTESRTFIAAGAILREPGLTPPWGGAFLGETSLPAPGGRGFRPRRIGQPEGVIGAFEASFNRDPRHLRVGRRL